WLDHEALADGSKPREELEHPARDERHGVGEEQDAGEYEKAAEHFLDGGEMPAEPLHCVEERTNGNGRDDEGNAEAKRVDEEQAHPLAYGVLACGDSEDRAKHRADAWRPAEGKGESNDIGADQARRPRVGVVTRLAVQNGKMDHAEEMQPGDDDHHAGDLGKQREVCRE